MLHQSADGQPNTANKHGGAAEGTVRFALDRTDYEIDLSIQHSGELHNTFRSVSSQSQNYQWRRGKAEVVAHATTAETIRLLS